jgi:hypothetical protein
VELNLKQMQEAFERHLEFELACDLDGTMATVAADPHYEIPPLGWRIDGRDAVREMYRRFFPGRERAIRGEIRLEAAGPNALVREAYTSFRTAEGGLVTGQYMAVIFFDGNLVSGERTYADPVYANAFAEDLGADFGDVPGVSRIGFPVETR